MNLVEHTRILLDESGGSVFWETSHLLDALNEAHLKNFITTKYRLISTPWVVEAGSQWVSLPDEILIPQTIEDSTTEFWISSLAQLEQYQHDWKGASAGIPKWFVRKDARTLMPWPMPDQDYQYTMVGLGWPTEITSSLDPVIPGDCQSAIAYRTASQLLEHTQPTLAELWAREADEYEQSYKRKQRNAFSHNLRRLRPGTNSHDRARSGNIIFGKRI
jgi:hypothetical protein